MDLNNNFKTKIITYTLLLFFYNNYNLIVYLENLKNKFYYIIYFLSFLEFYYVLFFKKKLYIKLEAFFYGLKNPKFIIFKVKN